MIAYGTRIFSERPALLAASSLLAAGLLLGCGGSSDSPEEVPGSDASTSAIQERDSLNISGGSSGRASLTQDQKRRLGPALRRLLTGDTLSRSPGIRRAEPAGERDGESVFSVLIEGASADTLRKASLPITSVAGGAVTARLTKGQIRKAASLESVQRIRLPGRATSQ